VLYKPVLLPEKTVSMKRILWISLIFLASQLSAQSAIPPGTILPVRLNFSLNTRKVRRGQVITARVMEDVPLWSGEKIHAGATVRGHVVDVKRANRSQVSLRFDTLVVYKRPMPIITNLRAVAGMMAVEQAQIPNTGPDRGTPENWWATDKVGGESGPFGRLLRATHKLGTKCRGEVEGNDQLQALWVFSSDACGAYGFTNLEITHAGRNQPVGEITLASNHGDVNVRSGGGMLLRVNSRPRE
jgi:hypothetical protein